MDALTLRQITCGYIDNGSKLFADMSIMVIYYLRTRCIASLRLRCRSSLSRGLRPGFDGGLGAGVGSWLHAE